ncbi:hypothetical protein [Methylomonas albis]|uniref:Uncharacterized protein n=1 Tax=Methylomonas albis TaxID=1854563 RepID=A0ABR9D2F0_9GAMM|nr:hypothetical protein [Methylomonas albis]MBD9357286.1 hypothetical protein [Methylomonas albis]
MKTKIAITLILATVVVIFLFLFRDQVNIAVHTSAANVTVHGENNQQPPPGIRAEDVKADGNIKAHDKEGRGIDVKKITAKGDITLVDEKSAKDSEQTH